MIVFKNSQDIHYAFFSSNIDIESLKEWLIFYRKFDETIKAYREDNGEYTELNLLEEEQSEPENSEKSSRRR